MTDETYNGWTNWETWNTHLWITNEEGTYSDAQAIVGQYADEDYAAQALREWWDELNFDGSGPIADAWSRYIERVDWRAVAEALSE